jgi:hypothetical protein
LLWFFGWSGGLMIVYALVYGIHANFAKNFDGGLVSARWAMCFITWITTGSFLYRGVELQMKVDYPGIERDTLDQMSLDQFWLMALGPVTILAFAVTYATYVHLVHVDSRCRKVVQPDSLRGGRAINTIVALSMMTIVAFAYCVVQSVRNDDGYAVLHYMLALGVAGLSCFVVGVGFAKVVPPLLDRGWK